MVKTDRKRLEEQVARANEINRMNARPPSLSRRMWAKLKKFHKRATSGSDRLPREDHWGKCRIAAASFIFSYIFEAFMGLVMLFNIFLIFIQIDRRIHCVIPESPECPANYQDVVLPDRICLGIYILELALRIFVHQRKFFVTRWNVFDTIIVFLSILGEFFGSVFRDAVIIRVIRGMRLVRMLRLLTFFQELYLMMAGMALTIRTLVSATITLVVVLSVQALVAVELLRPVAKDLQQQGAFQECPRCNRAFDSVLASMITFFQTLLMGEGVNELLVPLIEEDWIAGVFLIFSAIFVYLGLSNLILTVILIKAKEVRKSDSFYASLVNAKTKHDAKKVLIDYWRVADMDMSKSLTLSELRRAYHEQADFRSYFESHDMDLDFLQYAFRLGLKGRDEEDGALTFDTLAEAVIQMKTSEVGPVMSLVKCQVATIIDKVSTLQNQVSQLTCDLSDHMAINARACNSEMEHGRNVINAINAINSCTCHNGDQTEGNGNQKEGVSGGASLLGSDWWSRLSATQPVKSKQAEPHDHRPEQSPAVIDVDQWKHTNEDPIHQTEEGQLKGDQSEEDPIQQSDDHCSGPQPQETDELGHSPGSGSPDLAEMLKSAYGNPLPLDLPNLDEVQRYFAKLCEQVEAQLDRLDSHWIDDANQFRAQSKKEVYAAGARLFDRLGKSMTRMLKESGAPPPKPKLRRHQIAGNAYFGDNLAPELPAPPSFKRPPMYPVRNIDDNSVASAQNKVTRSQTNADDEADKAMQHSERRAAAMDHQGRLHVNQDESTQNHVTHCQRLANDDAGTRSAAMDHQGRKGRSTDQHERARTCSDDDAYKTTHRSESRSALVNHQGRKGRSTDQDERARPPDITRSRTLADNDAYKATHRLGSRSASMDHQGRKGRSTDQDERGKKRSRRPNTPRMTNIKEF